MWRNIALPAIVSIFVLFSSTLFATDRLVPSQYATIQAAINASVTGDTVIIADGTYTGTGNKNLDFAGRAITVRSANGPANCIIDCQNSGRGFYFHSGETTTSIVSGLTIKNGKITGDPAKGGAIYCIGVSPLIENCIIKSNTAQGNDSSGSAGSYAYGGGVFCDSASNPVIENCIIANNSAKGGKGADGWCTPPSGCLPSYYGGNAYGGGIYASSGCSLTVTDCNIANNTATGGLNGTIGPGGITGSGSHGYGGGMYGGVGISNSSVCGNVAVSSAYATRDIESDGGGIYALAGSTIVNCLINANSASNLYPTTGGSAIYGSGTVRNCTILNNSACCVVNTVYCTGTTTITNCIFKNNNTSNIVGGSGYSVTYSCTDQSLAGTGNVQADPLFVSGPLGDFYLSQIAAGQSTNSPCVNTGTGTATSLGLDDFTTRSDEFHDKDTVDMGYHYTITPGSVDIKQNLHVDLTDYALVAATWLQCSSSGYFAGDIDKDECVTTYDLGLLADAWLDCYVQPATTPAPADDATGIGRNPVLSWTGYIGASDHDIYLGTSLADVNNATTSSPVYCGRINLISWDSNGLYPAGLVLAATYYWRIDEVGAACVTKGSIWHFTVAAGGPALNPTPVDKAAAADPKIILKWSQGAYAISHDVYFGTNSADVNTATTPVLTTDVNSYNPGTLNFETTYYWRIDEYDSFTTHKGSLWSFTTISGKASNPNPSNAATDISTSTSLSWSAAPYATSHDVYIGTSSSDVNSSTTPVATTSAAIYNPGALNYSTTYYWRIDEFDGAVTVKGDIWSFTTGTLFDPNLGLVSWWKLDETSGITAADSALTNHGTLNGNPVWTAGQIDGALSLDGIDDYVNCGSAASLDISSRISISAWVKFNSLSGYQTILAKRGATSDSVGNYALRTNANKLEFYYRNGTTWHIYTTSATNMVTGIWYHAAVTFTYGTGSSIKCYLSSVPLTGSWTSGNGNAAAATNTKPLTLGALTNGERINGTIDDIRIYNRALSATDVQQLYESGLP